jgi:hypothetical protein
MKRVVKFSLLGVVWFAMSLALGSGSVRSAQASQTDSVLVVNTVAEPVPVSVSNTPTVIAQQSGTWTVSVGNLPGTLNVAGTVGLTPGTTVAADPSQAVTLSTAAANAPYAGSVFSGKTALAVHDVTVGQRPFTDALLVSIDPNQFQGHAATPPVPAGKRAVIEYVDGECALPTGLQLVNVYLDTTALDWSGNQNDRVGFVTPIKTGNNVIVDIYTFQAPSRIYVEPGQVVTVWFNVPTPPAFPARCTVNLTGYLVDTP